MAVSSNELRRAVVEPPGPIEGAVYGSAIAFLSMLTLAPTAFQQLALVATIIAALVGARLTPSIIRMPWSRALLTLPLLALVAAVGGLAIFALTGFPNFGGMILVAFGGLLFLPAVLPVTLTAVAIWMLVLRMRALPSLPQPHDRAWIAATAGVALGSALLARFVVLP